ncbi:hypothetical protein B296_00048816 [Ensete ventricosum]|uniref:Uncharacterized protein n=1 Tax=Ensete ventricosum TaxID=4639 RepID=A0A426YT29_ENSVE|nr:hypothetical protein B296_00048816 [Ensete ventricosum]
MIWVFFPLGLEADLRVKAAFWLLLNCGPDISLSRRGAVASSSWATDYNINLSSDRLSCACCARSESVESDDNVSSSCWVGSTLRYGVVDFFEMIEGVSDRVSGGSCASRLGSRWRDCDLRDGHDSRSRWDWLLGRPVGEETGNTILRHGPFL